MDYRYAAYAAILGISLTTAGIAAQVASAGPTTNQVENRTTDQLNRQQLSPQQAGKSGAMPSQTVEQPNPAAGPQTELQPNPAAGPTTPPPAPDQQQMIRSQTNFQSFK